jgi:hypothetical protein
MSDERTFTVQIAVVSGDQTTPKGSGAVVGPRLVLTAHHVVSGVPLADLRVRLGPAGEVFVVEEVLHEGAHDIALVRVGRDLGVPAARLDHSPIVVNREINAIGYPSLHLQGPRSDSPVSIGGWTRDTLQGKLAIDLTSAAAEWAGMSGAAVRMGDRVVAVVGQAGQSWVQNNRLLAVPVANVAGEAWFADAVFPGAAAEHRAACDAAWRRLEALVSGSTRVRDALTEASGASGDVLAALRARPCPDVLDALDAADVLLERQQVAASQPDRTELWSVIEALAPHLVDWEATMLAARASATAGRRALVFELCRETLAEVMLAGVDGRPCRFRRIGSEKRLGGEGFVPVPGALRAPIRPSGSVVVEAVGEMLGAKVSDLDAELLRALGEVTGETEQRKTEDWAGAINAKLARQAAGKGDYFGRPLRRSLVVLEQGLSGSPDVVWATLVDHLGRSLSELRLVRLTTPPEKVQEHTALAAPIEDTYARRAAAEGDHDEHHDG